MGEDLAKGILKGRRVKVERWVLSSASVITIPVKDVTMGGIANSANPYAVQGANRPTGFWPGHYPKYQKLTYSDISTSVVL